MKKLILLIALLVVGTSPAMAADYGLRAGLSLSPDQFVVGGHANLGPTIGSMRLVPNIELGLGDNLTYVAFNGDLIYDFASSPWSLGGELGLNVVDHDNHSSQTDLGLSVLGNYRVGLASGNTLTLEAKLGLVDSPDAKFTVGWSF